MQTIEDEEPESFRNYASNDFEYISGIKTFLIN
jgi:hypothetical protein